jgi:hypothetical protein|tara:strand:+ start:335 stop:559 length:225 start_codon:yes stop_codon:yes gene_type:complete
MKNASVTPAVTVTFDEFDDASALVWAESQLDIEYREDLGDLGFDERSIVESVVSGVLNRLGEELFERGLRSGSF